MKFEIKYGHLIFHPTLGRKVMTRVYIANSPNGEPTEGEMILYYARKIRTQVR